MELKYSFLSYFKLLSTMIEKLKNQYFVDKYNVKKC